MQNANQTLQALRKLGEQQQPLTRVYRCLYNEELYLLAYNKLYRNQGALTPGTEQDTVDGMSLTRIRQLIANLRAERFRFRPARRISVPKPKGGSRPLGLPNFTEKLVQEVLHLVLETYYEPRFRNSSHGFRPERGCHTALTDVVSHFQGSSWFIEGDIKGCFDHIDHQILLDILARDIHDGRLLNLIRMSLQAGAMDAWTYHQTYSGTPQGGVLSPLLTNIYLHELDVFIEDTLIPQYTRGKERQRSRLHRHLSYQIRRARARGDVQAVSRLRQEQRVCPSKDTYDPTYRRLAYVRYADDFLLGFAGPKAEAETVKAIIGTFLQDHLHLMMSDEKTLITHARTEQARFLNYAISIYHADNKVTKHPDTRVRQRSINGGVRLGIPQGLIHQKAARYQRHGKVVSDKALTELSDATIIDTYQQRYRGLAEYYKFATDRSALSLLKYTMEIALVKTLAHKFRLSVKAIYRKYRTTCRVGDQEYVVLQVRYPTKKGERNFTWGAIPLKTIRPGTVPIVDKAYLEQVNTRSDLLRRLQADTCELCGSQVNCEVHHVRKLVEVKRRWAGRREKPNWVLKMIAMRRKTLIVCRQCHTAIHNGTFDLPKRE